MNYPKGALLIIVFLLLSCSQEPKETIELSDRISRIENGLQPNLQIKGEPLKTFNIESRLKELGIPGVSIAILNQGEIEWAKAYGMADSSENRAVTTETLFLAGSISKPVAALRAHQLVEQGIIHLDSNVNNYLSSWKLPDNNFTTEAKVTTRNILNHTAGLTVWGFPGYDKGDTIPSIIEVLDGEGNTDAVRVYKAPNESWMYSGGGYSIMQLLITDVEQNEFPPIMQQHVLNPLGMTGSTFENPLPEKYHPMAATGYRSNGAEVEGKWPIYPEMAAAGLWTTPSQLILWAKEIQQIYQDQKDGLLKVATVNEMLTPGMNNHGLGPTTGEHMFGHGGADEGFRARLIAWKEKAIALVIMVNSDNGSIIQEILLSIATEYELPGIQPRMRETVQMTPEELAPFVGNYRFDELGNATISQKDNGLEMTGEFADEPYFLLPSSETQFFDTTDGDYLDFTFEDGKVTGFKVLRFEAAKVD